MGMTRKRRSIRAAPEIIESIAERTRITFQLQTKIIPLLAAEIKTQRKFRFMVIGKLARIESAISLLLVDQMAHGQLKPPFYNQEDLEKDAKAAEEFISKQASERSKAILKYIHKEAPQPETRHDRRRKWHNWEI